MSPKSVILVLSLVSLIVFAQECGKISQDNLFVDVSEFTSQWRHDAQTEYEMSVCSENFACDSNKWPVIQRFDTGMEKKCYGLGKLSTATTTLLDSNITKGVIVKIKEGDKAEWINPPKMRAAEITFICSDEEKASATDEREVGDEWVHYFEVRTKKACPQVGGSGPNRPIPGLGVGGLILIIVFVLIIAYFTIGIVLNKYKFQKSGMEVVPHASLLSSFPGLVKDGIMFIPEMIMKKRYSELK